MPIELGYALASEEHDPIGLVDLAVEAERAGFGFATVSDHFHPWINRQGHSPFVWSVLGGIARETRNLQVGTAVTCPTIRIHPAIIAQAAATVAAMMPRRFFLGVGTGENLNEHILGSRWPAPHVRLEMLEEAIHVIRHLWQGGEQSHHGRYYTVEDARIYDLPEVLPPIAVAASGSHAADLAGRSGDALISVAPDADLVQAFARTGNYGPRYGQLTVCWAASEKKARRTALELWPNAGLPGKLFTELPAPKDFEQATKMVDDATLAESIVCGPDARKHLRAIEEYVNAGYDHVSVHQVGPDQKGFLRFYEGEILPRLGALKEDAA
jgi:G6PDH family F420-dependent oxidoreductase